MCIIDECKRFQQIYIFCYKQLSIYSLERLYQPRVLEKKNLIKTHQQRVNIHQDCTHLVFQKTTLDEKLSYLQGTDI